MSETKKEKFGVIPRERKINMVVDKFNLSQSFILYRESPKTYKETQHPIVEEIGAFSTEKDAFDQMTKLIKDDSSETLVYRYWIQKVYSE